jgi:pyroglutamyl-peptidase
VVGEVLPVSFDDAARAAWDLVGDLDPDVFVGTGLAGGRTAVAVERVGLNVDDCVGVADNDDAEPRDRRIDPAGPDAYFATVPAERAVERLLERAVPARLSNTAGTHCCNHLLSAVRRHVEREGLDLPVGFVHLLLHPAEAVR